MATRNDVTNVIAYIKMCYSNFHPVLEGAQTTVDVWFDILGDLPVETLQAAVKFCCSEAGREFAPSPGNIRGAVVNMLVKTEGIPDAGEAWTEVLNFIRDYGCRSIPNWSHEIVKKTVDTIGLVNIGMAEDIMPTRAHFLKIYKSYFDRAAEDAGMPASVVGYIDERRQLGNQAIGLLAERMGSHDNR